MKNKHNFSDGSIEQLSLEAGLDVAIAANMAYDQSQSGEVYRNHKYQSLMEAAGLLIGENSVGDPALTEATANLKDVELINLNANSATAGDFGLMPRKQREQFKAIKNLVLSATVALDLKYRAISHYRNNNEFALLQSDDKLIVAYAGDVGYSIKGEWDQEPFNLVDEGLDTDFEVRVANQTYDVREGMTLSVYDAISVANISNPDFELKREFIRSDVDDRGSLSYRKSMTVITGDKTPRNGFYIVDADGLKTNISPQQLVDRDLRSTGAGRPYLGFRPAIVLDFPKI